MDLPVNPNFTQFRSREPADSRVEKFVKAYTKANCEVRVNMVLEEAITWPKMLVKAFEKMHQMRKVGFKKAASLKRQSKPRNPERRTRQQHRVPAGSAAGPSGSSAEPSDSAAGPSASAAGLSSSSAAAAAAASPDVIDAAAAAAEREALWQQALAEEGNAGVMSDSEGMEEDLFGLPSP